MTNAGTVWRLLLLCLYMGGAHAETHLYEPVVFHTTYSHAHPPVLRILPGDTVVTWTLDAGGDDSEGRHRADGSNPQTGPFYIEGAEAGDTLIVALESIEPNRATGWSGNQLAGHAVEPASLLERRDREYRHVTWHIDAKAGVVRMEASEKESPAVELPLRPMLGCVAVAPPRKEALIATKPGPFGGNMDYPGMVAGTKLMLPVFEPGALLFIGDGHARQGDGEVAGVGIETSMDVRFSVDLLKGSRIEWPRLESADYVMTLGSARPLLEAFQYATSEMHRWIAAEYPFSETGLAAFLGQALEYEIANVVDPNFTVVAKVRKTYLPRVRAAALK